MEEEDEEVEEDGIRLHGEGEDDIDDDGGRQTMRTADGGKVDVKVVGEVEFEVFGKIISEVEVEH